jgi:tripartite ATP-independent transporter DctP family solute receptor
MRKVVSFLLVSMLLLLTACAGTTGSNSAQSSGDATSGEDTKKEPFVLKMNMVPSNTDPTYKLWEEFAKELEDASEGTLKVEIYPSETLGKTTDMIETISKGAPILQDSDPSHLSDYVPDFSVFMHPYLFKKPEDIEKAWKSEEGQRLVGELEKKGLKIVTMVYFGTRHLLSNKEVTTRDDTKDMKIRNAPTKMWNEVTKTLGGSPTNTAWSEVYTALSQGVADAAESPLALLYSSKIYETRENISLTGHLVATTSIVMSKEVYDSLPEEAKKAIDEVGSAYPAKRVPQILEIEDEFRQKLESDGIKFNEVEKEPFIEASKNVSDAFPEWTPGLYDKMIEAIE